GGHGEPQLPAPLAPSSRRGDEGAEHGGGQCLAGHDDGQGRHAPGQQSAPEVGQPPQQAGEQGQGGGHGSTSQYSSVNRKVQRSVVQSSELSQSLFWTV